MTPDQATRLAAGLRVRKAELIEDLGIDPAEVRVEVKFRLDPAPSTRHHRPGVTAMTLTMTPHAIRLRTILDLHAALLLAEDDVAAALFTMPLKVPARYVSTVDTAAVTSYAADLLDLDTRIRYLAHGPDAVDAYLTEEELTTSLKYHHGDKDALRDRMLMDLFAQLDALIRESAPDPVPALG